MSDPTDRPTPNHTIHTAPSVAGAVAAAREGLGEGEGTPFAEWVQAVRIVLPAATLDEVRDALDELAADGLLVHVSEVDVYTRRDHL